MAAAARRRRSSRSAAPWLASTGRVVAALAAGVVVWLGYVAVTVPDVRPLARTAPESTAFMRMRAAAAHAEGRPANQQYRFVPYGRIAEALKRAVLVAEDSGFWEHEGVEVEAMRESLEASLAQGTIVRGGSTITQQLAKNLYLSPSKDPFRKVRELMITRRLESQLSKRRILELYLNVVEWGNGTWGAEAASRHYFRKSASALRAEEAALLAGALINPNVYSPAQPPRRLLRRRQIILRRMNMRDAPVPPAASDASTVADAPPVADSPVETPSPATSSEEQVPADAPTTDPDPEPEEVLPEADSPSEAPAKPPTPVPSIS
jgi:monofunctional biosynthetic peptidoglycan transglycosylase